MRLEFKEIEAIFATRYGIEEKRLSPFRGRLQHLQRLKFPEGINTGKGKKAEYGWKQFAQLSLALDLIDLGYSPEKAVTAISCSWAEIELVVSTLPDTFRSISAFAKAISAQACTLDKSTFVLLAVDAISSIGQSGLAEPARLNLCSGDAFLKMVKERDPYLATFVAIDLTVRLLSTINIMCALTKQLPEDVARDLAEWGVQNGER